MVRDLSLHGAFLCLGHRPRLQSELNVLIEVGGAKNPGGALALRGTVVHREAGPAKEQIGVGVVFIDEAETGRTRD